MQILKNILTEMHKNKKVVDLSEENKKEFILSVKEKFSKACQRDVKLTNEYKKYVLNLDNIFVKINYGYQIKVLYRDITIKSSFDYISTYEKGKYIKDGKAEIDYDGNIKIDSAEIVTDYGKERNTKTTTDVLYSTTKKQYVAHLGAKKLKGCGQCKRITNFDMSSPELIKAINYRVSSQEFDELIQTNLPEGIEDELLELNQKRYNLKSRTFNVVGVEDYNFESVELTIMPTSIDVFVDYNGNKYEKTEIKDASRIPSVGEFHERYNVFASTVSDYKSKEEGLGHKIFIGFAIFLIALPLLSIILLFFRCDMCSAAVQTDGFIWRIVGSVLSAGASFLIFALLSPYEVFSLNYDTYAKELNCMTESSIRRFVKKKYKVKKIKDFSCIFAMLAISVTSFYFIWIAFFPQIW